MRPPNLPTAAADILAGISIAGLWSQAGAPLEYQWDIILLLAASVLLYAGGVVLNDVSDAALDAVERPERPIPSGQVSRSQAGTFGVLLLVAGIAFATFSRPESGAIALLLSGAILAYDFWAKQSDRMGPLFMGICRGLNLWLGISILPGLNAGPYVWVPLVYIFAVTAISRGEVHGGNKNAIRLAAFLYAIAIFGVGVISVMEIGVNWISPLFLAVTAIWVYRPLWRAYRDNRPGPIRAAVKAGVLGIVWIDAAWAAGYGGLWAALAVLGQLVLAVWLARRFAVT